MINSVKLCRFEPLSYLLGKEYFLHAYGPIYALSADVVASLVALRNNRQVCCFACTSLLSVNVWLALKNFLIRNLKLVFILPHKGKWAEGRFFSPLHVLFLLIGSPSMFSLYSTVHLFRGCNSNLKGGLSILMKIPTPLCPHPMVFVISILCIWFWDIISSHILMCMTLPLMVCMLNLLAEHAWAVAVHLCTHPIFV